MNFTPIVPAAPIINRNHGSCWSARTKSRAIRGLVIVATLTSVASCSHRDRQAANKAPVVSAGTESNETTTQPNTTQTNTEAAIATGSAAFQAEQWLQRAKQAPLAEKASLQLRAAEYLFEANDQRQAISVANRIDTRYLTAEERNRHQLAIARGLVFNSQNSSALRQLYSIDYTQLNPQNRSNFLLTQAQAELALGNKRIALEALVNRENYLQGAELGENQKQIWSIIDTTTASELNDIRNNTTSQNLEQWIELATLADNARAGDTEITSQPLENYSLDINAINATTSTWDDLSPAKVALLLPLNSQFGAAAQAVQQGFKQAHRNNASSYRPEIQVYDISDNTQYIAQLIDRAIADGADFIVGPLGKNAAQSAIDYATPQVPMLVLGGTIKQASTQLNVFSLNPEQEINAIAQHAYNSGYRRASSFYPDSIWGDRLNMAFASAWENLGGQLVSNKSFRPEEYDHSETIKDLLAINASNGRFNRLAGALGFKPKFTPSRRSDIDFLFLAARTNSARVIKPQLSFHQAHDLPVYATSSIYGGNPDPVNNADLNSVIFPDMPWILNDQIDKNLGGVNARLFAFGYDAYQLIPTLRKLNLDSSISYQGLSGTLQTNSNGEVIRIPQWAKFTEGRAVSMNDTNPTNLPTASGQSIQTQPSVINRSNRYDSKNWDQGANRRKKSP